MQGCLRGSPSLGCAPAPMANRGLRTHLPSSTSFNSSAMHRPAFAVTPVRNVQVAGHAEKHGVATAERTQDSRFFYFDPLNPENVVEVVAKAPQHVNGHSNNRQAHVNGSNGHAHSNGTSSTDMVKVDEHKLFTQLTLANDQLRQANHQLDVARKNVTRLQQYELLYKEQRMANKHMLAEVSQLQAVLADKDAELARQYKRMERDANERSGLRSQYTTTLDEVKALRTDLEEARQAMLELKGVMPARRLAGADLGSGVASNISVFSSSAPGEAGSNGNAGGHAHGSSAAGAGSGMLQGLAGLQGLARQLLDGMEGDMSGSGVGGRR